MLERSQAGASRWAVYRNKWRDAVIFCSDRKFGPAARLTTAAILRWCNKDTWSTFVGEATIAAALQIDSRTVRRHIAAAVKRGLLVTSRRGSVGPSGYRYRTLSPAIDGQPGKEPPPLELPQSRPAPKRTKRTARTGQKCPLNSSN